VHRQEKSRAALGGGKIQKAPGLTINRIVVSGRTRAHTPDGVSSYARWLLSRVLGVRLSAFRAAATEVGGIPLLAMLVYVADEHQAFKAGTRTLQARVVRLYGFVVIVSGWERVGCARLSLVHSSVPTFLWAGLREMCRLRGAISLFLMATLYYSNLQTSTNVLRYLL
jgi:hypothetical protein